MSKQNLQNHICFILDASSSMSHIAGSVRSVFSSQIQNLRNLGKTFDQETRVSVYAFNGNTVDCLVYDTDVERDISLEDYKVYGSTNLIDAILACLSDIDEVPVKYGDHAFVVYVLTDGEENNSQRTVDELKREIKSLGDNITLVALVPNNSGRTYMERLGFPKGNIDVWDATSKGVEELGRKFKQQSQNYMMLRSTGVKSSNSFLIDTSSINKKSNLKKLDRLVNYEVVQNSGKTAVRIDELVSKKTSKPYVKGNAFYELVKTEHIQSQKEICVQNLKDGKFYSGNEARTLLNLPDYEVKVKPSDFGDWAIFVQSTSLNRNIIPKQRVLVL